VQVQEIEYAVQIQRKESGEGERGPLLKKVQQLNISMREGGRRKKIKKRTAANSKPTKSGQGGGRQREDCD